MYSRLALGSILVALAPALVACDDEATTIGAGDVVQARLDDQFERGRRTSVILPVGRLLLRTEEPVDAAAADETRRREAVDAPAGTVLLPIMWQWDTWGSDRLDGIVASHDTPRVDLVSGGEHYRLPPPDIDAEGGESFYVVVAGDGEDRSLEIEFDGVTQTLDLETGDRDEGRAAALYDIDDERLRKSPCENERWFRTPGVAVDFDCSLIGPVLTPYAGGEWAPEGSLWMAMTLAPEMRTYGRASLLSAGARYTPVRVKVRTEVDGARPVMILSTDDAADVCPAPDTRACGWSKHLIFKVPEDDPEQGPLDVKLTYRMRLIAQWGDGNPPKRTKIKDDESLRLWRD